MNVLSILNDKDGRRNDCTLEIYCFIDNNMMMIDDLRSNLRIPKKVQEERSERR